MQMSLRQQSAYAYKDKSIIHISEVSSGLACGCVCYSCGKQLIAKKGKVRIAHFAHHVESECSGATETLLHMLAKELVSELEVIKLPEYEFYKSRKLKNGFHIEHRQKIVKGGNVEITQAFIEQNLHTLRPDIIIESGEKRLLIEIAVTHKVDKNKLRRIRQKGIPALEIQLEVSDALLTREELKEKLNTSVNQKFWLFHPKQKVAEREYISKVRAAIKNQKKLRNYPNSAKTRPTAPVQATNSPAKPNNISVGFSNAELDRRVYEFFCKNSRQPTDDEYKKLYARVYGGYNRFN